MTPDEYIAATDAEREAYLGSLGDEALLQLGIDLYNAGHFWHAHEAWEQVWMDAPTPMRLFYQGLIQVTAAFVHVVRNEYPGAVRLLEAGVDKLVRYPPGFQGVDLAGLMDGAGRAHARLVELGERRVSEFDRSLIPVLHRSAPPATQRLP